ncbi:MAG: FKBP-type peptidyl-prolyl cis-trans isomerase [Muribaculaceae bacterium]|nr:FKBP-type peptidyl-prolyl cis-trans isomerase [Muribaculaceae bacterium]
MKKLLLMACAAGLMAVTSCNGNSASADATKLATAQDSLNYYMGSFYGSMISQQMKNSPDSAKFNADDFIKGINTILASDTTKQSYIQGMNLGFQLLATMQQFKAQDNIELNSDKVMAALKAALNAQKGDSTIVDPMAARMIVGNLLERLHKENMQNSPEAIKNKKAGEAFIDNEMKKDATIKKTNSGLAYKVTKAGAGETFKASDAIDVKYVGKHIDGKEFDSSRGEIVKFTPNSMTPGFKEALMLMNPGAEMTIYVPADLAYGIEGQPQAGIQSNETLVFDIVTVGLSKAEAAK